MKISIGKFKIIKYTTLIIFILFQIYLIFIKKHYALDFEIYPNAVPSPNIFWNNIIGQTFIAERDNLARIDLMLGTHERINDKDVFFELWEIGSKRNLIIKKVFNASTVKNNLYYPIEFKPIKKSRHKKYYFILYSPESTPENSISIWMNEKDIYRFGECYFNHNAQRGDLNFRVYSKRPIYCELGRVVRNYSGILGNKLFLILTIIFFEIIQILFLAKLIDLVYYSLRKNE